MIASCTLARRLAAHALTVQFVWPATFVLAMLVYFEVQYPRGIDTNFDLKNYHISSWLLLWRGNYFQNVAPSGMQHFFSPFVNFFSVVPMTLFGVRLGGIAIAVVHAATMATIASLLTTVVDHRDSRLRWYDLIAMIVATMLLTVTAPMPVGTMGTSFADNTIALGLALAVWIALRHGVQPNTTRAIQVALILSFCVALKPTAITFAVAHGLAFYATMAIVSRQFRPTANEFAIFALTSVGATAIMAGVWMAILYAWTGNPVFPFANAFFRSPLTFFADMSDDRFLPTSFLNFINYPVLMALGLANVSEVPFKDARYLIAFLFLASLIAISLIKRKSKNECPSEKVPINKSILFLTSYFFLSIVFWRYSTSIQRYFAFGDMILAILLVYTISKLPRPAVTPALILVVAAHIATLEFPEWGHRPIKQTPTAAVVSRPSEMDDVLVFLGEKPMGYAVGSFGPNSRFVLAQIGSVKSDIDTTASGPFAPMVRGLLHQPFANGIWALYREPKTDFIQSYLKAYNLKFTTDCRTLRTFVEDLVACRLEKF